LVALAISGVVLVALYGAVVRAAVAKERTAVTAGRVTKVRGVLLGIAGEIETALVPDGPGAAERFVVVAPDEERPAWAELRLATMTGDDERLVGYRVEAGALVRRESGRFAPPDTPEPRGSRTLPGVRTFHVRCFDGSEWKTTWTAPGLPRAVELTLGVDDGAGGVEEFTTAVALPLGGSS
jgi:hypothetical protein